MGCWEMKTFVDPLPLCQPIFEYMPLWVQAILFCFLFYFPILLLFPLLFRLFILWQVLLLLPFSFIPRDLFDNFFVHLPCCLGNMTGVAPFNFLILNPTSHISYSCFCPNICITYSVFIFYSYICLSWSLSLTSIC